MIITRTPFRISFAGGGSDLESYYSQFGGSVLSASINKYMYLSIHPFFNKNGYFLKYSQNELADDIKKIDHRIIREVFKDFRIRGVDFNSSADIPAGTGLGSSSAFTVGLINLCSAYRRKKMSKSEIATQACQIEIVKLSEPIGKQDQYACAVGGLNFITFQKNGKVVLERLKLNKKNIMTLENNLLLYFTGFTRQSKDILEEEKKNIIQKKKTISFLHRMVQLSKDLKLELEKGNIDSIGEIMNESWMFKKKLASGITNEMIDTFYSLALKNGALGGKLLGAGGGGFLLFYVTKNNINRVRGSLAKLKEVKFRLDHHGTTIIYNDQIK